MNMNSQDLQKMARSFHAVEQILKRNGRLTNDTAKAFACYMQKNFPNIGIIAEIAKRLEQCSSLTQEELEILHEILAKYQIFSSDTNNTERQSSDTLLENQIPTVKLTSEMRLIDLTSKDQSFREQYSFVFGDAIPLRQYILFDSKDMNGINVSYLNYVFGNGRNIKQYSPSKLQAVFSRDKVVSSIMNSFGCFTFGQEIFSEALKEQAFLKLLEKKSQTLVRMHRSDGSRVSFLRIGKIYVSSSSNLETESLDQYLVWSTGKVLTTQFLSYGNIDVPKLSIDHKYAYAVVNMLLSEKNLNASRYIGSILGNYIHKNHALYGPCIRTNEIPHKKLYNIV